MEEIGSRYLYRDLKCGEEYHPARALGKWMILVCLVILVIVAVTGIIPLALQLPFMILLVATMFTGFVISLVGYFKSIDRNAYPFSIAMFLFVAILITFLYIATR